jgi:type IV pilus assembly protein PilC
MPTFQYIASGSKGESIRGTIPAADKGEVARKLSEKGLFLVFCKAEEEAKAPGSALATKDAGGLSYPSSVSSERVSEWWSRLTHKDKAAKKGPPSGSVPLKELVIFTRQISISINAGMSFVEALQGIVNNMKNPRFAYVLQSVLDDVLSGNKLSESMAKFPDVFKTIYVSMVSAGEAGGFLPDALNRVAEFLEKEIELRSKIKSAMVYPAVIGCVATLVVIGMMIFIIPVFVKVFTEMGAPLPGPTQALIVMSNFTRNGGFLTPFIIVAFIIWMKKYREKNEKFRAVYDDYVLKLPLFGKLMTLDLITRFIRTLATLVENGVMALQAINIARQVVDNRTIQAVVDEIYASVQQGNGIANVLYRSKYFPVLVANMVSTGEKTGSLPEVLMKMAKYYEDEVSSAIRDLLTLMEPLLIVVMAVIVGFIILGLMLPTFQMSSLVG